MPHGITCTSSKDGLKIMGSSLESVSNKSCSLGTSTTDKNRNSEKKDAVEMLVSLASIGNY